METLSPVVTCNSGPMVAMSQCRGSHRLQSRRLSAGVLVGRGRGLHAKRSPGGARRAWRVVFQFQTEERDLSLWHESVGRSLACHSDSASICKPVFRAFEALPRSLGGCPEVLQFRGAIGGKRGLGETQSPACACYTLSCSSWSLSGRFRHVLRSVRQRLHQSQVWSPKNLHAAFTPVRG